ncbi:MAG: hypothetical protein LIO85_04590 [Rikenellaceae bacterium]|nr:hypothetical protein [Rikenellaceae bacterium]
MIKFTAFRTQKPRQFNYIPRYYDPEAEAREERRKQVLGLTDEPGGEYVPGQYIRSNMRRGMLDASKRKKSAAPARLLIMLVLAGIGFWFWLDKPVILIGVTVIGFVAWRTLTRR